jgi:hypothetical protein
MEAVEAHIYKILMGQTAELPEAEAEAGTRTDMSRVA